MSDAQEIEREIEKKLKLLSELSATEFKQKKQIILEIRDYYLLLHESSKAPFKQKTDLASFIWYKLEEKEITVNQSYFYTLFRSDEKNERKSAEIEGHIWEPIGKLKDGRIIEECQLHKDETRVGGIIFDKRPDETKTDVKQEWSSSDYKEVELPEPFNTLLGLLEANTDIACSVVTDIRVKCGDPDTKRAESVQKAITESIDVNKMIKEQTDLLAKLEHLLHLVDFRERLGEFEKTIIRFYELVFHLHEIGKLINISAKHIKNSILDENDLMGNVKILGVCPNPKCGLRLADWYNENKIRRDMGLEPMMEKPKFKEIQYTSSR